MADPRTSSRSITWELLRNAALLCTLMFIAALFTIVRTQKQPRHPSGEEWVKMCYIYTMKCCFSVSKSCPTLCNPTDRGAWGCYGVHGVVKSCMTYCSGILLRHKKKQNNAIFSDMDGPRECHTEWSNSEREIQILYNTAYMWNLDKWYGRT